MLFCYALQNTVADSSPTYAASQWFLLSTPKKAILSFLIWPCHSPWLGGQLSVELFTG